MKKYQAAFQNPEPLVDNIVTDSDNSHSQPKQRFPLNRRSGVDRRSGVERRIQDLGAADGKEQRSGLERRSKLDQRSGIDRRLPGQELSDQSSLKERSFTEDDFVGKSSGLFTGLVSAFKQWLSK